MTLETLPIARNVPSVTAAQMAEADRVAAEMGIPLEALMENAAHQIAWATRAFLGDVEGKLVVALVGSGNNGGDALGALRHLAGWGAEPARASLEHEEPRLAPKNSAFSSKAWP